MQSIFRESRERRWGQFAGDTWRTLCKLLGTLFNMVFFMIIKRLLHWLDL